MTAATAQSPRRCPLLLHLRFGPLGGRIPLFCCTPASKATIFRVGVAASSPCATKSLASWALACVPRLPQLWQGLFRAPRPLLHAEKPGFFSAPPTPRLFFKEEEIALSPQSTSASRSPCSPISKPEMAPNRHFACYLTTCL